MKYIVLELEDSQDMREFSKFKKYPLKELRFNHYLNSISKKQCAVLGTQILRNFGVEFILNQGSYELAITDESKNSELLFEKLTQKARLAKVDTNL